jgi:hypothetical protein
MRSWPGLADRNAEQAARDSWSAPLRLLIALLHESPDGPIRPGLSDADWDAFARLTVDRHRVAPAIRAALEARGVPVPGNVRATIEAAARDDGFAALAQKAESRRLLLALGARGLTPMLLKGWPLAEELFGSAGARHSKDIDLYIDPGEIAETVRVLGELGYAVDEAHRARARLMDRPAFVAEYNDLSLWNAEIGCQVEIHWRSNHFRGWTDLREAGGQDRTWPLDATGLEVRIPSPAANLAYLALHGQQHVWARLKWLFDIASILHGREEADLMEDLAMARRAGAGRAVIAAVHLAHRVFGAPLPQGWPRPGWIGRYMLRYFLRAIADDNSAPGTARARFGFYWVALMMAEDLVQRLGVLRYAFWRGPRMYCLGILRTGDELQ